MAVKLDRPDLRDLLENLGHLDDRAVDEHANEFDFASERDGKSSRLIEGDGSGRGRMEVQTEKIRSGLDTGQSVRNSGDTANFDQSLIQETPSLERADLNRDSGFTPTRRSTSLPPWKIKTVGIAEIRRPPGVS